MFGRKAKREKEDESLRFINPDGFQFADPETWKISDEFDIQQKQVLHYMLKFHYPARLVAYPDLKPSIMLALCNMYNYGQKLYKSEPQYKYPFTENDIYMLGQCCIKDYANMVRNANLKEDARQFYVSCMLSYIVELTESGFPILSSLKHKGLIVLNPKIVLAMHSAFTKTSAGQKEYKKLIKLIEDTWNGKEGEYGRYGYSMPFIIAARRICWDYKVEIPGDEPLMQCLNGERFGVIPSKKFPKRLKKEDHFHTDPNFFFGVPVFPDVEIPDDGQHYEPGKKIERLI